jgi:hypothetical protein
MEERASTPPFQRRYLGPSETQRRDLVVWGVAQLFVFSSRSEGEKRKRTKRRHGGEKFSIVLSVPTMSTLERGISMTRDDWYFLCAIIFSVLAFLGIDWKVIRGKVAMNNQSPQAPVWRQRFLLAIVLVSFLLSGIGLYSSHHADSLHWTMTVDQLQEVYGRTFRNETVVMDGKKFDHCTFDNVTFVYHGLTPYSFVEAQFVKPGKIMVKTDNDGIKGFYQFIVWLDHQPGISATIEGSINDKGNIVPLVPGVPITTPKEPAPDTKTP